jgi:uncharacterized protein DUF6785/uncharacterized protein DUF6784
MVSRRVTALKPPAPTPAPTSPELEPLAAPELLPAPSRTRPRPLRGTPPPPRPPVASSPPNAITRRAILLGLLLIPPNVYWVGMIEGVWHGLHFTCLSLAMNVVFFLLLLMGGNALIAHRWPARAFTQAELLTVFGMLAISSTLCGHDKLVILMGVIGHAARFATPENHWGQLFLRLLPDWLVLKDPDVGWNYYTGGSSMYSTGYWRYFVWPAIAWGGFIAAAVGVMLCLNVLIRKRWTEEERLSYPIVQIPLAMTDPRSGFFSNRLMWLGFALAAAVETINGLNYLYPSIPALTYRGDALDLAQYLPDRPWSAMGATRADFYPFMVGLAFLLPQSIIFSTWVFHLIGKAQMVVGAQLGWTDVSPDYPYFGMQAAGAVVAIGCVALWEARGYLRQVGRRIMGQKSSISDADEAISYRAAAIGALLGFAALVLFAHSIGMPPWQAALYFGLFFLIALTVARLRADSGAPAHGLIYVTPHDILITHFGTAGMASRGLAGMALFTWFNRFNRAHPMSVQLESMKIAHSLRTSQRRIALSLLLASGLTIVAAFLIYPHQLFHHGGALAAEVMWTGWVTYGGSGLEGWLTNPKPPDHAGMGVFAGSALFALLLALLRARYVWFPLHPMGFALGVGGTVDRWWFALLLCSVIKGVIIHYGGVRGFQKAAPFFMGLVLGNYVVACIWSLIAIGCDTPMYWGWQG